MQVSIVEVNAEEEWAGCGQAEGALPLLLQYPADLRQFIATANGPFWLIFYLPWWIPKQFSGCLRPLPRPAILCLGGSEARATSGPESTCHATQSGAPVGSSFCRCSRRG